MRGKNIFKSCNMPQTEIANTKECLFNIFVKKIKPKYNDTKKSLQFQKLVKPVNENAEQWLGRLRLVAVECNQKSNLHTN